MCLNCGTSQPAPGLNQGQVTVLPDLLSSRPDPFHLLPVSRLNQGRVQTSRIQLASITAGRHRPQLLSRPPLTERDMNSRSIQPSTTTNLSNKRAAEAPTVNPHLKRTRVQSNPPLSSSNNSLQNEATTAIEPQPQVIEQWLNPERNLNFPQTQPRQYIAKPPQHNERLQRARRRPRRASPV